MADTSDIRKGLVINFNSDLYKIVEFQHVKPGKGPAFVRTKLKSVTSGKVVNNTFPSGHKIDIQRVENRPYQYLYKENDNYHFMHRDTYEQTFIQKDIIEAAEFLKEGQEVDILVHADTETPLSCELPAFVTMKIIYTEPGIKGDTATNSLKDAEVETGANVRVPLFIENDTLIRIDTRTGEYVERIN
jgi:elongation factor P